MHVPTPAGGRALRWHRLLRLVELEIAFIGALHPLQGIALERGPHDCDGSREIAEHELCADADDTEARALQLAITAGVRALLARVNGAIDLNYELDAWSQKVSDEEPGDGHLAAKGHAELTSIERGPQRGFRLGGTAAMLSSEELEPSRGFRVG